MKPGTSIRNTSGMLKASQSQTNRAALSAEFTSRAPPSTMGWLARMPTGWPPMRARPVTMFLAQSGLIGKNSPSSTTACTTLRTSYARRGAVGTISYSSSHRRSTGSSLATTGGSSLLCEGKNER